MATLTIRNFPDDLYAQLKARAAEHRRSLSAEGIECLERTLRGAADPASARLEALQRARARISGVYLTDRSLRAGRRRGRP